MAKRQIDDLRKMMDQGILSKEEFEQKKKFLEEQMKKNDGFDVSKSEEKKDSTFDIEDDFVKEDEKNEINAFDNLDKNSEEESNESKQQQFDNALNNGYSLEIGEILKESTEIFKQKPGEFIGFTIAIIALYFIIASIPILGSIGGMFVNPVLAAGFYIVAIKLIKNQEITFKDFFLGLKIFMPLAIAGIIASLTTVIGFFLFIIPGIYLSVSFSLAPLFIIDHKLDFWPALDNSRKLTNKNFFPFLGLILVLGLINIGGALVCGVGLLFTIPVTAIAVAVAFNKIIKVSKIELEL